MSLRKLFMVAGVTAIPVWYAYRTVAEGWDRNLQWSEILMTEPARQQKRAEEKQKMREAAEAERMQRSTELEKATAARKSAEVEAAHGALEIEKAKAEVAKAQAEATRQLNAEAVAESRRKDEQEHRAAEAASMRQKAEAEKANHREVQTTALRACEDAAKIAERSRQDLLSEQMSFRTFIDETSKISSPEPVGSKVIVNPQSLEAFELIHYGSEFTRTFRMLSARPELSLGGQETLKDARESCAAKAASGIASFTEIWPPLKTIENLAASYNGAAATLRRGRADIVDVVDFVTSKLPNTLGADVRRARAKELINRGRNWRESQ